MPYSIQRFGAGVLLLFLSPVLACIAVAIRLKDGSPVLFRQTRLGKDRRAFEIFKFRTMVNDADRLLTQEPSASRLTVTGAFLRRSSLDELPQLLNVVRGDMAGVGPRAILPEVAKNLPATFGARFDVLPGLTGLAQVRGRNDLPWSQRLAADVEYAATRSFFVDLRIILMSVLVVIRGSGFQPDRNSQQVDDLGLLKGDG